jgi:flagellar biogenesis protein FliO
MFKKSACTFLLMLCSLVSPAIAEDAPIEKPVIEQQAPPIRPTVEVNKELAPDSPEMITGSYESAFFKMLLTLGALLVLIFLSVWMLRRISRGGLRQGGSSKSLKILERKAISAKSVLYVVEVEGKKVLISESQLEVRPITTLDTIILDEET